MDELTKKDTFGTGPPMGSRLPKEAHFTNDKNLLTKSRCTSEELLRLDRTFECRKWVDEKPIISVAEALSWQNINPPSQDDEDDTNIAARKRPPQDDADDINTALRKRRKALL
ncbi:hypothetical protein HPB47_016953 [Ixodes persulcatus]|uniref:Uncharacterized protein n=1 Tax=Ixodes persulcatus TaxID=34615 RepID=A0AC60QQJ7_IXOPE|nr:hypothetical protein HPB47_016953 [Ixodes persulcatus]